LNAGADASPDDYGMNLNPNTGGQAERSGPCMSCKSLEDQLAAAEAKVVEAENGYKRMAADFENYRKRTDREREEFQDLGAQKAVGSILIAVDDLDRAQSSFNEQSDPNQILQSLKLLYNRFLKTMETLHVKPLDVVGQPFDPRSHEPVQQVETNAVPEGHVAQELRRGYSYKDKILRPALVNVATPATEKEEVALPPAEEPVAEVKAPEPEAASDSGASVKSDGASTKSGAGPDISDSGPEAGHINGAKRELTGTETADVYPIEVGELQLTQGGLADEEIDAESSSQTYDITDTELDESDKSSSGEYVETPATRKQVVDE
jgi:molecular chaperone GrpE